MIVEINEMIDFLDDFLQSDRKITVVGGIAGTQIEKITVDRMTSVYDFNKILIINGVQDYIYFMKKPLRNVKFWADIFVEDIIPPKEPINVWAPKIYQPKPTKVPRIDTAFISQFDCMVVLNSQVLDWEIVDLLANDFGGRIVFVTDPVEHNAICVDSVVKLNDFPVIVDSMEKLSPIIALARNVIGFETRAIEHRVKCDYKIIPKINKRTVNKLDNTVYFTDDWVSLGDYNQKQIDSNFKKGQKVLVRDRNINIMLGENGVRKSTVAYGSLLTIDDPRENPLMKHKIWNSKEIHACDVAYTTNPVMMKRCAVSVIPANVLSTCFIPYHRYDKTVFLRRYKDGCDVHRRVDRVLYTILKCSNNVTIVEKF